MTRKCWTLAAALGLCAAAVAHALDKDAGRKLYDSKCASCHAKDAKGSPALAKAFKVAVSSLSLLGEQGLYAPEEEFIKVTAEGAGKMPAYKDKLSDSEMKDIASYVGSLAPAPAAEGQAPDLVPAQKLFAAKCGSCHGKDGKGNAGLAKALKLEPALLDLSRSETSARKDSELAEALRGGKGKMPGYADKLSDDELKTLIGLIRSWKAQQTPAPQGEGK